MTFYEDWTEDYRQELKDAGAQFSGKIPISGLNIAMQEVEGAYDEETDTGFTETGAGSFLGTLTAEQLGRTYEGALSIGEEQDEFQAWKDRMGYGDLPDSTKIHGRSLWELWGSSRHIGRDFPFNIPGVDGGDGTGGGGTGGDPYTSGVDDNVRADMKDAFFYALRVAGMEKDLIDKLWDWAETELVNDPSFTAERALIGMYDSEAFRTCGECGHLDPGRPKT